MAIHQEIVINASPKKVYQALTSGPEFTKVTGAPADISTDEGGAFTCFGGQITGRHIELHENTSLVQAWRAGAWPEGHYSIVRITLDEAGEDRTTVTLDHAGFPEGADAHLEGGWHKMYWEPLKDYCA